MSRADASPLAAQRAPSGRARAGGLAGGVLLGLGSALGLVACVGPDVEPYLDESQRPIPGVAELGIDRGGQVQLEPGTGIGVAVQYGEGGAWQVTAACDTALSAERCDFDIVVSTDETAVVSRFAGEGLEPNDELRQPDEFALTALFDVGDDIDAFSFTATPGATVRVSALLYDPRFDSWFEWSDDPRIISWVGNGGVHHGAPTNPVDLTPDRP
jgi:hypothetical protein